MDDLEKQSLILDLLDLVDIPQLLMMYYDYESDKLLDLKISVLEQLRDGKSIDEIDGGYRIFELLPFEQHWD